MTLNRKESSRKYSHKIYIYRKINHLCVRCGILLSLPNYKMCNDCRNDTLKYSLLYNNKKENKLKASNNSRNRRQKYKSLGLCTICGNENDTKERSYCSTCSKRRKIYTIKKLEDLYYKPNRTEEDNYLVRLMSGVPETELEEKKVDEQEEQKSFLNKLADKLKGKKGEESV